MKQSKLLILLLVFFLAGSVHGQFFKTIDVGKIQCFVYDHGCMSDAVKTCGNVYYFRGSYVTWEDIRYADDNFQWPGGLLKSSGMFFGARNWTDTTGHTWDAILTGHGPRYRESEDYQFGVPDEDGFPIRRYMRYAPPRVTVDGMPVEEIPFNSSGDEVAPEKILGTADIMVESNARLSVGVDVKQRVLAWSQPDHDDYIIWDWTFVNTGNVDRDKDIELSGQTLNDVYICRVTEAFPDGQDNHKAMPTWAGTTENHDTRLSYPQDDDSLRIDFLTPMRSHNTRYDNYGKRPDNQVRLLNGARFAGTAVLFAPKSCDVTQFPNTPLSNDPAQPCMHSSLLTEPSWIMLNEGVLGDFPGADSGDHRYGYELMVKGGFALPPSDDFFQDVYYMDSVYDVYDSTASGAKTHYEQPLDRWDELASKDYKYMFANDIGYMRFDVQCHWSIGPYQMGFMDTLRYVYAYVGGAIDRKTSYLLGEAWDDGNAASYGWLADMVDTTTGLPDSVKMVEELKKRDPIFNQFYDSQYKRFLNKTHGVNDIAKDLMVATGKDSLFENGMNAQRNFNKNYNIPASPAPPSFFEVKSKSDMVELTWDYDDGPPLGLDGFKIYRAEGGYVFEKIGTTILGDWYLHDSIGPDKRLYADTAHVTPGRDYFYALTAFNDDGVESGKFLTMTTRPARLISAPADNLDSVRVVPNPLHVGKGIVGGFPEGEGNKIAFYNLPGECIITILTESGNLVTTIDHDKDAGIAVWEDIAGRYLFTDSDQFPVSGIYIAHIQEKATGKSVSLKFVIVR